MDDFSHVTRIVELTERDIEQALESRDACRRMFERVSQIAAPNTGAPKLLLVFARMATAACDWIDGGLRIEIVGDEQVSVVDVLSEMGASFKERLLPAFALKVPLSELTRAVVRMPHMVKPLVLTSNTSRRMVLTVSEEVRRNSLPPAAVKISEESLIDGPEPAPRDPRRARASVADADVEIRKK